MTDLPIACSLDPADLDNRGDALLPGLVSRAEAREELADGFRWRFPPSSDLLRALAEMLDAERQCCRFLRFQLTVEPDLGPLWLSVTGPKGTREFLASLIKA
jgi:hypothetical protein